MARILIADDSPGFREWLAEILTEAGHAVASASDGLEAQGLARRGPFDLAVTDISMPNEEGLGLIRALRRSQPGIKIIAISGLDIETLNDARLLGATRTLRKPITAAAVLECVAAVMSRAATR
jgi:CheY-like chemotaxis protein